ncbi:MAG TPA: hypothetical protein VL981_02850 [Candidatus Methylacidiphilales bacterium]|nr:hypothetical protein [Candidatus Methylacidiphilales bacterium]
MLSERTIINALILAAGLIVGPYLTIATVEHDYLPILIAGGIIFLLVIFFFVGDRICALPMFGLCFAGKLDFLPFGLTLADLCSFVTVLYYLVSYVALRQRNFKTGPRAFFFPIITVGLIILYHQKSFGLHAFGGNTEGSRPALLMLVCVTCYFCGINIATPSIAFLQRVPWYALTLTVISNLPYIITTYAPQAARSLIYLSDNVNTSAYFGEEIVRQGAQAEIGAALQAVLLAYFPIYTWWRPYRWWVACLSFLCFYFVAQGGYRSDMALYVLLIVLGAWCYCSWRTLFLVPPLIIAILGLDLAQSSHLVKLPLSVQRSLAFLPGAWDKDVKESTDSSTEFRNDIYQMYMREYFAKSPLVGNGFAIDRDELDTINARIQFDNRDGYYTIKSFVVSKLFHIGWISVYDAVGLIGTAAFIMLGANISYISGRFIFGQGSWRRSPLLPLRVWIFCNVTHDMIGFFTVFGSFSQTFTALCAYAIILAKIREIEQKPEMQIDRSSEHELYGLPSLRKATSPQPVGEPAR